MDRAIIRCLFLLVGMVGIVRADTRWVPADYSTIQAAIDDCNDGDVVLVAPGTYTGQGNRDIEFKGKAITVKSESGPETCIIDCQGTSAEPHRGFYFHDGEDANSIIEGLTITGGNVNGYLWNRGGGILCNESSPKIKDCIIAGNDAYYGGGISTNKSTVHFINCIIRKNVAAYGGGMQIGGTVLVKGCIIEGNHAYFHPRFGGKGGGILVYSHSHISNCTITGNIGGYVGGGICFRGGGTHVSNTIIWGNGFGYEAGNENEVAVWYHTDPRHSPSSSKVSIENSLIGNGTERDLIFLYGEDPDNLLTGKWICGDPCFTDPGYWDPNNTQNDITDDFWVYGDYHLKSQAGRWNPNNQTWIQDDVTSPCIDTGDLNSPIDLEPFPNGGIVNMGAYGGTTEASKSYFGEPICETIVASDINGDCIVDSRDFALMAYHWLEDNSP